MPFRLLPLPLAAVIGLLSSSMVLAADKAVVQSAPPGASQSKAGGLKPPPPTKLVDINSASKAELKTLPGIGDAEADRIIKARPYPSKAKLAVDKVISEEIYAGLKGRIIAVQPPPPKSSSEMKASSKS